MTNMTEAMTRTKHPGCRRVVRDDWEDYLPALAENLNAALDFNIAPPQLWGDV